MGIDKLFATVRGHLGEGAMASSARLCFADAVALRDDGDFVNARARALKALAYSVGVFHADYTRAAKAAIG